MSKKNRPQKPRSYRRPMPHVYVLRWATLMTIWLVTQLVVFAAIEGFTQQSVITLVLAAPFTFLMGYAGAYLWGRIFWSLWLCRLYPPIEGFKKYWWYNDRPI